MTQRKEGPKSRKTSRSPKRQIFGGLGHVTAVRPNQLRANNLNKKIFSTSLSEEGTGVLVEDFKRRKQRVPVEITADGTILDGERRWIAAKAAGVDLVVVKIVALEMTDSELREYIYDAYATGRDTGLLERLELYKLGLPILKKRFGRPKSGSKRSSDEDFLSAEEVREMAAKRAGFGSAETVRRAALVVKKASKALNEEMLKGQVTVNGAFEKLKREEESSSAEEEPEVDGASDRSSPAESASPSEETKGDQKRPRGRPRNGSSGEAPEPSGPPEPNPEQPNAGTDSTGDDEHPPRKPSLGSVRPARRSVVHSSGTGNGAKRKCSQKPPDQETPNVLEDPFGGEAARSTAAAIGGRSYVESEGVAIVTDARRLRERIASLAENHIQQAQACLAEVLLIVKAACSEPKEVPEASDPEGVDDDIRQDLVDGVGEFACGE